MRAFLAMLGIAIAGTASAQESGQAPGWPPQAGTALQIQFQAPSTTLVGTWRSGNFAYTFYANGAYVYVGAMGGAAMSTQSSEQGVYSLSGNQLTIQRQSGILRTSQNYQQQLTPQTTVYPVRFGNTPNGPAMELTYPTGAQVFYRQ